MSQEVSIAKIRLLERRAFRSKPHTPYWYAAWKNYHEALRLGYRQHFGQAPAIDSYNWLDYEAWQNPQTIAHRPAAKKQRFF